MPLLILLRVLTSAASLAVLGGGAYLAWSWYQGETYIAPDGTALLTREDWRIWAAGALIAFSTFGRFLIAPLLGRADDQASRMALTRGEGELVDTATGALLYVEQHGDRTKPTLILTHGWGLDSTIWSYAKRDLAKDFHLVVWDLPGLGKSRRGADGSVDPARFASDLQAVIGHVGAKDVVLIGHSIGGMTIQTLVRDAPDYVREHVAGIVLLNTTYTNPIETAVGSGIFKLLRWPVLEPVLYLARLLQPIVWLDSWRNYLNGSAHIANRIQFGRTVTRSQLNAVTLLGTRNAQGNLARGNQGMFRWDATGALRAYFGPVLVIGGKLDLPTRIEASRTIAQDARGSQLIEVADVNHNGFLENASVYNNAIAAFARSVVKSGQSNPAQMRRGA